LDKTLLSKGCSIGELFLLVKEYFASFFGKDHLRFTTEHHFLNVNPVETADPFGSPGLRGPTVPLLLNIKVYSLSKPVSYTVSTRQALCMTNFKAMTLA
jgi:hypothetical protein